MRIDVMPVYGCYEEKIDLDLYHAFIELILSACENKQAAQEFRGQRKRHIWQRTSVQHNYFEPYQLRYPGEVLERYAEKLGSARGTLRALALALGHTVSIQSGNMFIGKQRINFIQTVKREAPGDVYLQGALYLLETAGPRQQELLDKLTQTEYSRTEEALFVLSLMDDNTEGYRRMHDQIVRLFGAGRTISLPWNAGVLEWLIYRYEKEVKSYHGKNDLVMRTLVKLPYMNMKPDSKEFSNLDAAGYSQEEIVLTNSLMMSSDRLTNHLNPEGVTAERIAVACCAVLLNHPEDLPERYYQYLTWLIKQYKNFEVKYEGNQGIQQAVLEKLCPSAPMTILWLRQHWDRLEMYFDVFDSRYDILAQKLSTETYQKMFTSQMLRVRQRSPGKRWHPIHRWLHRYRKLTGKDYCETFQKCCIDEPRAFALLVEQGVLNLWRLFERNRSQEKNRQEVYLLKDYAMQIRSRRCFRFVRKLLNEYSFPELEDFFDGRMQFHKVFLNQASQYRNNWSVSIGRPFLAQEEKRQIFDWMDTSCFMMNPNEYGEFIVQALRSAEIRALYSRDVLAPVLRQLLANGIPYPQSGIDVLKSQLYTEKELEQERLEEAEQTARRERMEQEEKRKNRLQMLRKTYDGTMESLVEFTSEFRYREERIEAWKLVYEKLTECDAEAIAASSSLEIQSFFKICAKLLEYEARPKNEILSLVNKLMGGTVK